MIQIGGERDAWGIIPSFLDLEDPDSAVQQFNKNYVGGFGQSPVHFDLDIRTMALTYPGDPPLRPFSIIVFRDEKIFLYPSAWVLVIKPDGTWVADRMD